jgi:hypothetical protein
LAHKKPIVNNLLIFNISDFSKTLEINIQIFFSILYYVKTKQCYVKKRQAMAWRMGQLLIGLTAVEVYG